MATAEPRAALLIIGAEVLSGKIDDANGPFLIRGLRARGVQVVELRIVGDTVPEISEAVQALSERADFVFTTGGIGPTHDDVTIAGVAHAFGRKVVRDTELLRLLHARHPDRVNEARLKLAEVPEGAEVIMGNGSFVPVVKIGNVMVLPGVPSLMRGCFAALSANIQGTAFHSRSLTLSASEPDIADTLTDVQGSFPDVAIGSYPRFDLDDHSVKVTMDGRDAARVQATFDTLRQRLNPAWVVAEE